MAQFDCIVFHNNVAAWTVSFLFLNPNWFSVSNENFSRCLIKRFWITFSKIFDKFPKMEIAFIILGKMPSEIHLFKPIHKVLKVISAECFKLCTSIPSKPMNFCFLILWLLYKPLHQWHTKSTLTGSVDYCLMECNNPKSVKLWAHKHSKNNHWKHLLSNLHLFWYHKLLPSFSWYNWKTPWDFYDQFCFVRLFA